MGHCTCCVVNCKNNGRNSKAKFYRIPTGFRREQGRKWIAAIRRINEDGSPWTPRKTDTICSEHFIGGEKSNEINSPGFVPTIFPKVYGKSIPNETAALKRYERVKQRRMEKSNVRKFKPLLEEPLQMHEYMDNANDDQTNESNQPSVLYEEKGCQAEIFVQSNENKLTDTFICNSFIYFGCSYSDAQIQTEMSSRKGPKKILSIKQFKEKGCNTVNTPTVDKAVGLDTDIDSRQDSDFLGIRIDHIKSDEALQDICGVTLENFKFLLNRLEVGLGKTKHCGTKISNQNKLFLLLMKMKTALTFSAMSTFLNVHRTTVSRLFFSTLKILTATTANLVFWPERDIVQATMPDCFRPDYSDVRVIIDCTEFRIEVPATVENRVFCYSHYKKGFTAKLLVGILPSGFICFKSKVAGGRKSDSQITIDSGLIDQLEDGDKVLSDKGFPEIVRSIDETGKKVIVIMPPFLEKKNEFTKEETESTYKIASVRIHVERIMQRLRTYRILDKINENLFNHIDDIVHIACVLVNLQPPIIGEKKAKTVDKV